VIRIERDPAWWADIAGDLRVAERIGVSPDQIAAFICRPGVTGLATEHGGYVFSTLDSFGLVYEVHALFTPEGWGREAVNAAHEALQIMFDRGAQIIVVYQQDERNSFTPPISHGWKLAGDFRPTPMGGFRTWVLTISAWRGSTAVRRRACLH